MSSTTEWKIDQSSPELSETLSSTLALVFGKESIDCYSMNTGGGCMVCVADLSIDGRGLGRQLWLTRETDREWLLGFYDFANDADDEGLCVSLNCPNDYSDGETRNLADSALYVCAQVAGILSRLGVDRLQGE